MPGIVGIVSERPRAECKSLVKSMARSMEHESFDESDVYAVPEMAIYTGWMALENSTPFHRSNSKDCSSAGTSSITSVSGIAMNSRDG